MRKSFFFIYLTLIFINSQQAFAQTNRITALKKAFYQSTISSRQLYTALAVCEQSYSLNVDTLYRYASVAKRLAQSVRDRGKEVVANTFIENYLTRKNLFDSAIEICDADLTFLGNKHTGEAYSKTMMEKCYSLTRANRSREALDVAFRFLQESEKAGDTLSEVYTKCVIGIVYRNLQQTELAMKWFRSADATVGGTNYEAMKNEFGVYFLLGMMYNWKFDASVNYSERLEDSSQTIYFIDKAINDSRKYENLFVLARALNIKAATIGNRDHVAEEGNYVKEAGNIYAQLNDTISMLNTITPLCFYYIDEGHPEKGVEACLQGIALASKSNSYPVLDLYDALSQCYYAAGDYPDYGATLNSIITLKDSTYKVNSERELAELNARYNDQKKENIIIQQKLDISSKKYSILLISILTGILLISIFILYRYYNRKQKKMKQQEITAIAAAEEAERKRISADLHDNIGAYAAAAASSISFINAKDEVSTQRLGVVKQNVQDMIGQLNDSIWALNKKEVRLTDVSDRFKIFMQKLERAYPDITISVYEEIETDNLLSSFQALHIFRIMQEALNNALRHSKCTCVGIHVGSNASQVKIIISDNGTGISSAGTMGNGINNLKMRADELGWKAEWINNGQGGTSVIISSGLLTSTTNSALI